MGYNHLRGSVPHAAKAYRAVRPLIETTRRSSTKSRRGGRRVLLRLSKSMVILSTTLVLILLIVSSGSIQLVSASLAWSSPSLIDHYIGTSNILPTGLQASNGTVWLAWQSDRYGGITGRNDVLYKTITGTSWSSVHNFTSSGMNASPALVQLSNGTILMFWSANPTGNSCSPQCNIYYESFNGATQTWSKATQLSSGTFNDSLSSAAVGRDGTLWLVWTRIVTNCTVSPCSVTEQSFYRTLKNNGWSPEARLTGDSNWNWNPSVVVGKDSIVRVAFSKTPASQDNSQIYYKTYNGSWSSEAQIVSSSTSDEHPSLLQDRNGTLWLFWARKIFYTSIDFHYVLFNKFSYDNGKSWSSEAQMTNAPNSVDSKMPWAIQTNNSVSKSIWLFYSSNLFYNNFDIYDLTSSTVFPVHDVSISNISAVPGPGSSWTITVTVADRGDYSESVSVSLSLFNTTSYSLGSSTGSVMNGGSLNIPFTWNTASVPPGLYSATAIVSPVPGETLGNQGDNTLQANNLILLVPPPPASGGGEGGGHGVPV